MSASGKTTLARLLESALLERGQSVEVLDGDEMRANISQGLGYSRSDRVMHLRRLGFVADLLVRNGVTTIVAAISPYQDIRDEIRSRIGRFVEIYLNCPVEACIHRDPKGLYRKALAGEIKEFTGIDAPFEAPAKPEIELHTNDDTPEESLTRILLTLEMLKLIPTLPGEGYSDEEAEVIQKRLAALGYL